jgi:transposase
MAIKSGRRKWSASEKLRIVLLGMESGLEVSEVCRKEGINATQYYGWRNRLLGSAEQIFNGGGGKPSVAEERRTEEVRRLKDVVAEITAENLELKKGRWA